LQDEKGNAMASTAAIPVTNWPPGVMNKVWTNKKKDDLEI
jgi:flavin reductase (DIM6/NTAB) family NADH-FMN oxidoreductase RutF